MSVFTTKYNFGDIVYLRTDANQEKWIVTDIEICPGNLVIYIVASGSMTYRAYEFELSDTIDANLKLGIETGKTQN